MTIGFHHALERKKDIFEIHIVPSYNSTYYMLHVSVNIFLALEYALLP